mgnify:CR=1 FL=1
MSSSSATFIAGFFYGGTTVLVGQPLDTIKTLQQAASSRTKPSIVPISKELWANGGISAFYRGGMPLLLGGGLMRSAQFGVYMSSLQYIQQLQNDQNNGTVENPRVLGCIDPQVVLAGLCGGIGRGLVEAPFEFLKVRQQVQTDWRMREIFNGTGPTLLRNSFLFSSFVVYMDVFKFRGLELSPFWMGGICSNMAWLTVWPLDVVKSRIQSGKFEGKNMLQVLNEVRRSGHLVSGLVPGLARSFLANGSSMVVYQYILGELNENWGMK